ncbi:MAG: HNH endonuclease [Methylococcaceae bacterium]
MLDIMAIPLSQGLFALVDGKNYEWLMQWKWYAKRQKNGDYYAQRGNGRKTILMHRVIMKTPDGLQVDHKNHTGLDNRKANLRNCTHSENDRYQRVRKGGTSRYKGVSFQEASRKWNSQITYENKHIHLGLFVDEVKAALVYDKKARELFGEYALTNFEAE